jgi:hypothetical protein
MTLHAYPQEQAHNGMVYHKHTCFVLPYHAPNKFSRYARQDAPGPTHVFPNRAVMQQSHVTMQRINAACDLWVSHNAVPEATRVTLACELDKRRARLQDFTVPMYENIIDPNMFVDPNERWIACDWIVDETFNAELIEALQDVYVLYCLLGEC